MIFMFACMFFPAHREENVAWAKVQDTPLNGASVADKERIKECEVSDRIKPKGDIRKVSQLCGKALSLPRPIYPDEAKANRISGTVVIDIVTNEEGNVIWARAISGPEELRDASQKAACRARYSPTAISGRRIQTESSIVYRFVAP
jgi:TonB family protein